jgi:phosphatidylglycerol:prolipoprotein diacylglycerol transferase
MMALAFILGLWTASRRGLRDGIAPEKVLDIGPWLIIGTIVGARTLHVVTYWQEEFANQPFWEVFMVHHGGLVFYGGLIGASLACILYVRLKKIPLWKMADILAPSIALGYVFGRIGCLLNGCCYGKICDLPWAITYPAGHGTHPVNSAASPVHPSQIYDSLLSLGLYIGLALLYRRKKFDGQVFAAYLMCYAVTRSIVETFRGDYSDLHIHGGLTPAHLISIGIMVTGITLFVLLRRQTTVVKR